MNDKKKPRLLVTGASGFLGWTLCQKAIKAWDVIGTLYRHPVDLPGVTMCKVDLTEYTLLKDLFSTIRPDTVIHTAALSDPNYCQEHPKESELINVNASANIAKLCAKYCIPCVFTSTDLVFDGKNAPYSESSPVNPISIYGEQKARAEIAIQKYNPMTIVCRLPLMFGVDSPVSHGFFIQMLHKMKNREEVKLFIDEVRTPVSTEEAANGLILSLQYKHGTTLHLGGKERISRWDFGKLVAELYGMKYAHLIPCRLADEPMPAPRPHDVSLDSSKAKEIGYTPRKLREQLCSFPLGTFEEK